MRRIVLLAAFIVALSLLAFQAPSVKAHQPFDSYPPYHIEIGWENEPPVTWQQNAIEVLVSYASSGAGITGLSSNLTVSLSYAGQTKTWSGASGQIRSTDTNGTYHAPVILTQPGSYSATLTGIIGHTSVTLTASADANLGFERAGDSYLGGDNGPMFPTVSPSPSPTALQTSINNVTSQAMTMGYAGIALGIVGIVVGAFALIRSRKSPRAHESLKTSEDARAT